MPAELDKCVSGMLKSKKFKPGVDSKKRKSSAYAICTAKLKKEGKMDDGVINSAIQLGESMSCAPIMTFVPLAEVDPEIPVRAGVRREIEMLYSGAFRHPWYGDLLFNKEKYRSYIKNFDENVLGRDVFIRLEHWGSTEAAAWLRGLKMGRRKIKGKLRDVLRGEVEYTPLGVEKIAAGQYKYFSLEFLDNYQDKEDQREYGPTITGGAFLNNPFMTGLNPVMLSEDDDGKQIINVFEQMEEESNPAVEFSTPGSYVLEDEVASAPNKYRNLLEGDQRTKEQSEMEGEDMKELMEMIKQLSAAMTEIKGLLPKPEEQDEQTKSLAEKIEAMTQVVATATEKIEASAASGGEGDGEGSQPDPELQKKLEEYQLTVRTLAEQTEKLKKQLEDQTSRQRELTDHLKTEKRKNRASELAKMGLWPAVIEKVMQLSDALGEQGEEVITLSEQVKDDEGKVTSEEKKLSIIDAMIGVLNAIPETSRVDLSEQTQSHIEDPTSEGTELSADIKDTIDKVTKDAFKGYKKPEASQ